ncbi:unnamed protein product [Closterium sp. NIES-54]
MPKSPSLPKSPAHPKSSTLPKSPSLPKSPYAEKNGLRRGVRMERPHPPDSNPMRACESSVGGSSMGVPSEVPQTRGGTRRGVRGKQRGQQQLVPESFSTESEVSMRSMSPGSNMLARSVSCDQPSPQVAAMIASEAPLPEPPGRRFVRSQTEASDRLNASMTAAEAPLPEPPGRRFARSQTEASTGLNAIRPKSSCEARAGGGVGRSLEECDVRSRPPKSPLARMVSSGVILAQSGGGRR